MDRYDSVDEYAAAKARIFDRCDVAVVNADDVFVRGMPRPGQQVLSFSLAQGGADYTLLETPEPTLARHGEPLLPLAEMRLQGRHNAANALAALAMGEALALPTQSSLATLRTFAGLPHRAQWIADIAGVHYVNDSKGTNVGATVAAVSGMSGPLVVIAGGDGKGADFGDLRAAFRDKVRHVVLIGKDAPLPSPPAITTSGPDRPETAATVAPTLVPFESLTYRTPAISAIHCARCGSPPNVLSVASDDCVGSASASPMASAARAFAALWRPCRRISASGSSGSPCRARTHRPR